MTFECQCGHMPYHHGVVTYPTRSRPCNVCLACGGTARGCCLKRISCLCDDLDQTGEEA